MTAGIGMDLQWNTLVTNLGLVSSVDTPLNYVKFLDSFVGRVDSKLAFVVEKKQRKYVRAICQKLYQSTNDLKEAYNKLDVDRDGKLNYREFSALLKECNLGLTKGQMYDFMRTLDHSGTGVIEFEDFASRFEVAFKKAKAASLSLKPEEAPLLKQSLTQLGIQIFKDKQANEKLKQIFKSFGNKGVNFEQFCSTLIKFGVTLPESEIKMIFDYIDSHHNSIISFQEFKRVFKFVDKKLTTWRNPELFTEIQGRKSKILIDFVNLDEKGDGKVKVSDFVTICHQMNFTQLTQRDILKMCNLLADSNGLIDYNHFLCCFEIDCVY